MERARFWEGVERCVRGGGLWREVMAVMDDGDGHDGTGNRSDI